MSREQRRKAMEQQKKKDKKNKNSSGGWFKRIILTILIIGVIGLVFGVGLFTYYASSAPELDEELLRDPISPTFLAADGETEIPYMTVEDREYVNYEDIPKLMENAILATEDNRFYEHPGIDIIRLGGAVIANVTGGFGSQGASTITQQVIKNSFLKNDKTLERKAQEAYLAYQLEQEYSKEEIFEMYFNKILMSGNTYGFGTASENFFGKHVSELELHEAAMLAGMPQSPNGYNPFNNPDRAQDRRNIVLSLMEQHGKITTEEKEAAQAIPVTETLLPEEQRPTPPSGEYTAFMEMVENEIEALDADISLDEGLTVYTTLEPDVQKAVNDTMASDIFFNDEVQSALTVVDTETGAIRAIGAAREYSGDVRRNYATARDRQIGSTIKPLLDYGPAIEYLNWSTGKTLVDEPYSYEDGGQEVRNFDGNFLGEMTMREALYRSRNIPAIKTLNEVGIGNAKEFTQKLGLDFGDIFESAAIGSTEDYINTVDLAGAYAAFGNDGIYTKPHTVTKIVFRDGTTEQVVAPESVPAMKDSTAYMVTDMLRDVLNPNLSGASGTTAAVNGVDIAGKTGTTNYSADDLEKYGHDSSSAPDIWFAGYSPEYSISVWSGYPSKEGAMDTASNERLLSQQVFKDVMSKISSPDAGRFQQPESVVEATIEVGTEPLQLASDYTPSDQKSTELFVRGTVPNEVSEEFVQEDLDAPTGLRASVDGSNVELTWNYGDIEDVQFEVAVEAEGNRTVLTTTDDKSYTYEALEEGRAYTFSVIAVKDEQRSDPASVIVEVTPPEEPEEPEETPSADEEAPPENEAPPEDEAPPEGEGNGEGNGNGGNEGNGEGNGDGEAPPEDGGDGDGDGETPPEDGSGDGENSNGEANGASVPPANGNGNNGNGNNGNDGNGNNEGNGNGNNEE